MVGQEIPVVKLVVLGVTTFLAGLETLQTFEEAIVLAGAVVIASGAIWAKIVVPLRWVRATFAHLEQIPNIVTRLEVIEGAMYGTDDAPLPIRRRHDPPYVA